VQADSVNHLSHSKGPTWDAHLHRVVAEQGERLRELGQGVAMMQGQMTSIAESIAAMAAGSPHPDGASTCLAVGHATTRIHGLTPAQRASDGAPSAASGPVQSPRMAVGAAPGRVVLRGLQTGVETTASPGRTRLIPTAGIAPRAPSRRSIPGHPVAVPP